MTFKTGIIFILLLLIFSKVKSQDVLINISDLNQKYVLDYYFQEANYSDSYIPVNHFSASEIFNHNTNLPEKIIDSGVFIFTSYFTFDKQLNNNDFSLHIGPINYPVKIFLNGNLISTLGQLNKKTTKIQFSTNIYLTPALLNKDSVNEISIQAYTKKGDKTSLGKIYLSSSKVIEKYTFIRDLLREDIVQASMIFSLILSIYFLFGFFQKRYKTDKKYLFFALFCLGFSIGYSNLGLSYNFIDDFILYKLTRMGIPFAALMLVFYTIEFTQIIVKRKKMLFYILTIPIVLTEIIYAIQSDLAGIEKVFAIYSPAINLPFMLFCFVLSTIGMIRFKLKRHVSFFIGFIILFVGIFHDTYYFAINVIAYTWLVPTSFLFLIIATFFILASEQTKIFHLSIERGEELQKIKENLEILVEQRTEKINQQNFLLLEQSENLQEVNTLLEETNAEVMQQKEELMAQTENLTTANKEITKQKDLIEKSHSEITASINYAKRIQSGLLPSENILNDNFQELFILFKPKDIVSGDFYFFKKINDTIIVVVSDCTGHGVPGAFMSLLGIAFLNEIVTRKEINTANLALEELRVQIKNALHQTGSCNEQKDGMDLAFCAINTKENTLQYSGANNPIFVVKNNELVEFKPVRNPIGIYLKERSFENHVADIAKGDCIYMFTDGICDQFGGEHGRKFRLGTFRKLVLEIHKFPLSEQKQILENSLNKWQMNAYKQTDDITVLGFKY